MGIEENKNVVINFFNVIGSGDFDAAINTFAEDAVMWVPGTIPLAGTFRGRKEIADKNFTPSKDLTVPDSFSIEILHIMGEGDYVATEWIVRRKTSNGRDYENHFNGMFEVKNGMIQTFREYPDTQYAYDLLFA